MRVGKLHYLCCYAQEFLRVARLKVQCDIPWFPFPVSSTSSAKEEHPCGNTKKAGAIDNRPDRACFATIKHTQSLTGVLLQFLSHRELGWRLVWGLECRS